ncbi:sulfatase-like hydrolase/transferase [Ruania zhangjianzhongii]|uniref:sulfatase-like hydrolase/transferase n=1 Tax=Ruania zhangjianzhongii TaxID=2603206 RepID=UPI001651F4DD|nr:sulfatase-like hydrolase/transferase [Ruania zhangjianzhongii]
MPTNFVVIFLDDHAQWALSTYGNSEVRTPNLDYLANTGTRMDNAFTPTPVCSPSRACFLSGKTASQHGVHDYLDVWATGANERNWMERERTLPEILHEAGYTTGLSGKWHLGRNFEPAAGFDYWHELGDVNSDPTLISPWPTAAAAPQAQNPHNVTDRAVEFLRARDSASPFFLFVGYYGTHSPWRGRPERLVSGYRQCSFADVPVEPTHPFGRLSSESLMPETRDRREALSQYYASVTATDEQVGRLVDELDAQGVREDTMIIYTSDHGLNLGHHGIWGKGNGTKPYNMVDESIRIPLIINQPGTVLPSQVRGEYVTHCDLFSTVLEHAEVEAPEEQERSPRPSRSYLPLLRGGKAPDMEQIVFGEYGDLRMARTPDRKLLLRPDTGRHELFDLDRDPRETRNFYNTPGYEQDVQQLTTRIEEHFARHSDPDTDGLTVRQQPSFNPEEYWNHPDYDNLWWERNAQPARA